jgi:aminoglycoside phosphotransferase (APT) family kinase protein
VVALAAPEHPVLVHHDLGGDDLLWDPPRLVGVID